MNRIVLGCLNLLGPLSLKIQRHGSRKRDDENVRKEKRTQWSREKRILLNERGKDGCCRTGPRNGCAPIENARRNA